MYNDSDQLQDTYTMSDKSMIMSVTSEQPWNVLSPSLINKFWMEMNDWYGVVYYLRCSILPDQITWPVAMSWLVDERISN